MCVTEQQHSQYESTGAILMWFHIMGFVRIVAVDAVMVIATGNGVVKEDIAAKLEVHRAYFPGQ